MVVGPVISTVTTSLKFYYRKGQNSETTIVVEGFVFGCPSLTMILLERVFGGMTWR